jgi:hypothetical protein
MRGGPPVVLRSKSPDMIRQELFSLLCTYQAMRTLICHAVAAKGLDPDRISFTRAKGAIAARVSHAAAFPPADLADLHDDLIAEITHPGHLVPERPPRAYARVQKRPGGRFRTKKPADRAPLTPQNEDHILATAPTNLKLMPLWTCPPGARTFEIWLQPWPPLSKPLTSAKVRSHTGRRLVRSMGEWRR